MFGKSKIRKDFELAYKAGNEAQMQALMETNPWLVAEWESKMDQSQGVQQVVIAALGVMEDEIGGPAPMDEISFSLRVDFKNKMDDTELSNLLAEAEELGNLQRVQGGWQLTSEGAKIADNYLNTHSV
jgi:hypothetical protein